MGHTIHSVRHTLYASNEENKVLYAYLLGHPLETEVDSVSLGIHMGHGTFIQSLARMGVSFAGKKGEILRRTLDYLIRKIYRYGFLSGLLFLQKSASIDYSSLFQKFPTKTETLALTINLKNHPFPRLR